jgi:hypothetical protein
MPGERLSPQELKDQARIFARDAQSSVLMGELIAERFPNRNGRKWERVSNSMHISLSRNGVSINATRFGGNLKGEGLYLPELPSVYQVGLSGPAFIDRPDLEGEPSDSSHGLKNFHLSFMYQLPESETMAREEMGRAITRSQGRVVTSSRYYTFSEAGDMTKSISLEGTDDFMKPTSSIERVERSNLGHYSETDKPISAGEVELIAAGLYIVKNRLLTAQGHTLS